MPEDVLFSHIVQEVPQGACFYSFANAGGKRWLMPVRHMQTAMQLYQPGGWKGRLVRALLPHVHRLPPVCPLLRAQRLRLALQPALQELLSGLFGGAEAEFSLFCGTPCVHRKYTLQVSRGEHILGYCKLTGSADIAALFEREACLLRELAELGMESRQLPRVVFCGEVCAGLFAFVQSTVKRADSRVLHEWSSLQTRYLADLHRCTVHRLSFAETDFARTLDALESHLDWVPELPGKAALPRALARVRAEYAGREVAFSAYHADFTPWNMVEAAGELFVFDWEYAQRSYPPGLDRYHWYTQVAVFERKMDAAAILAELPSLPWVQKGTYLAYLLEVLGRFTLRERGRVEGEMRRFFALWLELIETLSA